MFMIYIVPVLHQESEPTQEHIFTSSNSITDRFCIAVNSALEQSHCAHIACDSE